MIIKVLVSNMPKEHSMLIFGEPNPNTKMNGQWSITDYPVELSAGGRKYRICSNDASTAMVMEDSFQFMLNNGYIKVLVEKDKESA